MPELPEIEVLRGVLEERLTGAELTTAGLLHHGKTTMPGAELLPSLVGQRVRGVTRHGKMLEFRFDGGRSLVMHLMLWGRVGLYEGEREPSNQASFHMVFAGPLHLEVNRVAARDFAVLPTDQVSAYPTIAKQGPDALTISEGDFLRRALATRSGVKAALLDQEVVAGVGNAYADEILYEARLDPFATVKAAGEAGVRRVYGVMAPTLQRAIDQRAAHEYLYGVGKALGLAKKHDMMKVHRKAGEPCPSCGQPVKVVAKSGRETFYCEHCQTAP